MGMTHRKNRITTLILIALLIPFFSIVGVKNLVGEKAYQMWQIASVVLLFLLLFTAVSEIVINRAVVLFVLYQSVILFSCFIHNGFSPGILTVTTAAILLFMLLQSDYYYEMVSAICVIVVLSVVINLPVMLPRLNNHNALFFIGGKNALGIFLVPGSFLLMINSYEATGKIDVKTIVAVGLCLLTVFIAGSGTGMVVAVIAAGLMLLASKVKPKKEIYILVVLGFYLLFILFAEEFFTARFWIRLTDYLGKDSTLTSRTEIWHNAKDIISKHWLIGSGRGTIISFINSFGGLRATYEAHNFILEILVEGGFAGLTIYAILLGNTFSRLDMDDMRNRIVFVALCVLLINGLTESTVNNFHVTIILGIACRYAAQNRGKKRIHEQKI